MAVRLIKEFLTEDRRLSFRSINDFDKEDMTNNLCDTLGKAGIEWQVARKQAGKYFVTIVGNDEEVRKAKLTIENCGFFGQWCSDAPITESPNLLNKGRRILSKTGNDAMIDGFEGKGKDRQIVFIVDSEEGFFMPDGTHVEKGAKISFPAWKVTNLIKSEDLTIC